MRRRSFFGPLCIAFLVSLLLLSSQGLTVAAPPLPIEQQLAALQPTTNARDSSTLQPNSTTGESVLYPPDDSAVQEGAPNSTDPSNLYLGAGYYQSFPYGADGLVRPYIRFDLSSLSTDSTVISATLRLYQAGGADYPSRRRDTTFYRVTENWDETSITWNNRPGYSDSLGSVTTTYNFQGWVELDMTAQVAAWVAGTQPNYGVVAIGPEGTAGIYRVFASGETSYSPELRVRYLPAPPPVLDVWPGTLSARASSTQPPPASSLQISNVTNGSLDWAATKVGGATWLALSKSSGSATPASSDSLSLTANASGLTPGTYTEQIRVSSSTPNVEGSPLTVTFTLEVVDQLTDIYLPLVLGGAGGDDSPNIATLIVAIADYQYTDSSLMSITLPDDWGGGDLAAPGFDGDDMHALVEEIGTPEDSIIRLGDTEATTTSGIARLRGLDDHAVHQSYPLATRANVVAAFGQLDDIEDADTTVIFYYSGHGGQTPDDNGDESDGYDEFIAMYDTDANSSGFVDVLTDDDLQALLADLESEHILVILDSCFSGSMMETTVQTSGDLLRRGLVNPVKSSVSFVQSDQAALAELVGPGRLIVTAGTGDQGTWESGTLENGVFTYFYLEALRESLNDANQNGRISAEEAYWFSRDLVDDWVVTNVPPTSASPDPHQNPDINDQYFGQMDLTWIP